MSFVRKNLGKVLLSLFVLLFVGYWFASPYVALESIKSAIHHENADKLSSFVDFNSLRTNLNNQLDNQIRLKALELNSTQEPLTQFVASGLAQRLVNELVTPQGLIQLLQGRTDIDKALKIKDEAMAKEVLIQAKIDPNLFEENKGKSKGGDFSLTMNYGDDFDHFFIHVNRRQNPQKSVVITLERIGFFSWQITDVLLPFSP